MSEYTYETPSHDEYFKTLLTYLKTEEEKNMYEVLKNGRCEIIPVMGQYSGHRWNAYYTTIHFYISLPKYEKVSTIGEEKLKEICNKIMPKKCGFDVMNIEFTPEVSSADLSLSEEIDAFIEGESERIVPFILSEEIKENGKEMARIYVYLYCIENMIRRFIETVAKKRYGESYMEDLSLNNRIRNKIKRRKKQEEDNKWIGHSRGSDIFYLDFKELSNIFQNNWQLFKSFFPNQEWITTKINDLAEIRNFIAHNSSSIPASQKKLIEAYYENLLGQIGDALEDDGS